MDVIEISTATGGIDAVVGVHGLASNTGIAHASGSFWAIPAVSGTLYSLTVAGAAPTLEHGGLGLSHVTGLTGDGNAVPEPGSLALLALGLGGIVVARRRRQRT